MILPDAVTLYNTLIVGTVSMQWSGCCWEKLFSPPTSFEQTTMQKPRRSEMRRGFFNGIFLTLYAPAQKELNGVSLRRAALRHTLGAENAYLFN